MKEQRKTQVEFAKDALFGFLILVGMWVLTIYCIPTDIMLLVTSGFSILYVIELIVASVKFFKNDR